MTSTPVVAPPFTIGIWVKFNAFPASTKNVFQKGIDSTSTDGMRFDLSAGGAVQALFSDGSAGNAALAGPVAALNTWYYLAFSYGSGRGSFYGGPYGGNFQTYGSATNPYGDATPVRVFGNFTNTIDGCVDDFVQYNRALSFDEIQENFRTVE